MTSNEISLVSEALAIEMLEQYPEDTRWINSPYKIFHIHKSKVAGSIAEKFTQKLLKSLGVEDVLPRAKTTKECPASSHDFRIGSKRIELKMSTEWQGAGTFRFQQIRDQAYDFCIFLGVTPVSLYLWCIPKRIAWQNCKGQHGGKSAKETKFVDFIPQDPPEWLKPYGGLLTSDVIENLIKITADQN